MEPTQPCQTSKLVVPQHWLQTFLESKERRILVACTVRMLGCRVMLLCSQQCHSWEVLSYKHIFGMLTTSGVLTQPFIVHPWIELEAFLTFGAATLRDCPKQAHSCLIGLLAMCR